MHERVAKLLGRHAGGLFEGDAKTVGALVGVHAGNQRDHGVGGEQIILRADDGDLFGNGDARGLTPSQNFQMFPAFAREN